MRHFLSFDIEEHFQVSAFASPIRRRHWDHAESRVERNTDKILEILDRSQVKATFFFLGWVAKRYPGIVRRVAGLGHEIASHGYEHDLVTSQTPALFREDIRRAKWVLEDLVGAPVLGYRAPSFSITAETQWALSILVEEGYLYDSSIFPVIHDHYGMPGANPRCHEIQTDAGSLWEVPPSTFGFGPIRVPVGGGGYFRLFPYSVFRGMLRAIEAKGQPLVFYLHPWELDPEQPKMRGPMLSRFRHYVNLHKTEKRLVALLEDFSFGPVQYAVPDLQSHGEPDSMRERSSIV